MIIEAALAKGLHIATAESITGGAVSARLAQTPGASKVLLGGITAYQDQIKSQLVGASSQLIAQQSAVDAEVCAQLAEGVRSRFAGAMGLSESDVIGTSTTGVAGPDSVSGKSVGEVFIGISSKAGVKVFSENFAGDRLEIIEATIRRCEEILLEEIALC